MADNQYISPFVDNDDQFRSADKTSYDITNPNPAGGPINDSNSGFIHNYTPSNKYLDNFQSRASNNSNFGILGIGNSHAFVLNNSIFEKTELDVEDPRPLGGPNRTNIPNIPSGEYINTKTGNIYGESPYPGGTLRNDDGTPNKVMVQRWNQDNTYLSSMTPDKRINPITPKPTLLPDEQASQIAFEEARRSAQGATDIMGNLPI